MSTQEQANEMTELEAARAAASAPKNYRAPVDEHTGPRKSPQPAALQVWSNARYVPTPSLDPGMVKAIEGYEEFEGYLAPALNAFSAAHVGLAAIAAARDPLSKDQSKPPEAKLLILAAISEKKLEQWTRAFDKAHKDMSSAAQALEGSLSQPLEASASGGFSVEIRAHIKTMKKEERGEFVMNAINSGDKKVVTAVLGAPGFLSGIEDPMIQNYTRIYREKNHPTEVKRLAATRRALDLLETRSHLLVTECERAQGGKWSDVRRLRGQTDASEKALAAITG